MASAAETTVNIIIQRMRNDMKQGSYLLGADGCAAGCGVDTEMWKNRKGSLGEKKGGKKNPAVTFHRGTT
jgi:hypothetical protein